MGIMNGFKSWVRIMPWVTVGSLVLGGCDSLFDAGQCPDVINWSISADVRDAMTGVGIALEATGEIRKGDYVEEMQGLAGDSLLLTALGEHTNELLRFYDVTVQAPGYESWDRRGVPVMAGECGIKTTYIDVWMEPAGG